MKDFADFEPREVEVWIGRQRLVVAEYVIAKRDAIMRVVLAGVNVVAMLKPLIDAIKARGGGDDVSLDIADITSALEEMIRNILSRDLTRLFCITLDTDENRKRVGDIGTAPSAYEAIATDKDHKFEYCPAMFKWIQSNMTISQEPDVLAAVFKVNDIPGLVKKYSALVAKMMPKEEPARDEEKEEKSQ